MKWLENEQQEKEEDKENSWEKMKNEKNSVFPQHH